MTLDSCRRWAARLPPVELIIHYRRLFVRRGGPAVVVWRDEAAARESVARGRWRAVQERLRDIHTRRAARANLEQEPVTEWSYHIDDGDRGQRVIRKEIEDEE
jgi:hypothetical protein